MKERYVRQKKKVGDGKGGRRKRDGTLPGENRLFWWLLLPACL